MKKCEKNVAWALHEGNTQLSCFRDFYLPFSGLKNGKTAGREATTSATPEIEQKHEHIDAP